MHVLTLFFALQLNARAPLLLDAEGTRKPLVHLLELERKCQRWYALNLFQMVAPLALRVACANCLPAVLSDWCLGEWSSPDPSIPLIQVSWSWREQGLHHAGPTVRWPNHATDYPSLSNPYTESGWPACRKEAQRCALPR